MYEKDEQGKTLHVYDFDDTITQVKSNIRTVITNPDDPDFFKELNNISDLLDVDEENNTNDQEMINIFRSW